MKLEIWKDIENYPNYQVSNFGRVKSKERISNCCYNSTRKTKEKIRQQAVLSGYLKNKWNKWHIRWRSK